MAIIAATVPSVVAETLTQHRQNWVCYGPYPYISRRLVFTRNGKRTVYLEHRVVWAIHYGSDIPEGFQIDHINGDTCDNRIMQEIQVFGLTVPVV